MHNQVGIGGSQQLDGFSDCVVDLLMRDCVRIRGGSQTTGNALKQAGRAVLKTSSENLKEILNIKKK